MFRMLRSSFYVMYVDAITGLIFANPHWVSALYYAAYENEWSYCEVRYVMCVSQQTKMIQLYTNKVCCFLISVEADISEYGAMVSISTYCSNHHKSTWQTAGESRSDSKPMNSLLLGSVLYTGSQPAKVLEWVVHHEPFHVKKDDNLLSPVSILPVIIIIPDFMEPQ